MPETYEAELARLRDLARSRGDVTPLPQQLFDKLRQLDLSPDVEVAPPTIPARVGVYRVIAERGRGGMGIVYEAVDETLNRRVAVKVLSAGRYSDGKARERFRREARAAASLQHENLVPVFATESPDDGPPYLVMPFIDGPTLGDLIATRRVLEPRFAALLVRQVASGVQALHTVGFLHRDIKPGNILLAPAEGDDPDAFVPKLTDFGLAREGLPANMTTAGTIAGTPSYLSPEQIHSPDAIDARADVYALGATLYESLAGVPPFRGATLDVLLMIAEGEPVPPRTLNREVPRDLETICLKCLAKRPEKRYATAAELRDDLDRFLAHEPIRARPAGWFERSVRWVQRNPWAAAVILVSVVGASTAGLGWWRAAEKTDAAEEAARRETIASTQARDAAVIATKAGKQADERARIALGTINALVGKAQRLADRSPGTITLKKELAEIALADLKKLVAGTDSVSGTDVTTIKIYNELGEIYDSLGNLDEARTQLILGLEMIGGLPADVTAGAEVNELAASMNYSLTMIHRNMNRVDEALINADASIAAIGRARAKEPANYSLARQEAVYLNGRADVVWNYKAAARAALADYRRSLAICEGLLPTHGKESQLIRDLAYTENRLAVLQSNRYEFADAEKHSLAASRYADQALAMMPQNVVCQRAARVAVLDRCNILCNAGDYAQAERLVRPLLPQLDAAVKADPDRLELQRHVAVSHSALGYALTGLGRLDDAAAEIDLSLTLREKLGAYALADLTEIGISLIAVETQRHRYDRAMIAIERNLKAADLMEKASGITPHLTAYRTNQREALQGFRVIDKAIADPAFIDTLPVDQRPFLIRWVAVDYARNDRCSDARKVLERYPVDRDTKFHSMAMYVYALSAAKATLPTERAQHLAAACSYAEKLFANTPPSRFLIYPELLPLRSYPPFHQLLDKYK